MGVNPVAFAWGLAEATLFFIVPDVWLSLVARERLRRGLIACLYALLGALIGGCAIYLWGYFDRKTILEIIERIPAIDVSMLARVNHELAQQGAVAVLLGPLSGTPYKCYAAQAAANGIGLGLFLLISAFARLLRFLAVTVVAHYGLKLVTGWLPHSNKMVLLASCWLLFYMLYFSLMPGGAGHPTEAAGPDQKKSRSQTLLRSAPACCENRYPQFQLTLGSSSPLA